MKKKIAALFLFLSVVTLSFADPLPRDLKVSKVLQENLAKAFPGAENVRWEKVGDLYVADFRQEKEKMTAFFEEEGALYKTIRYIDPANLPLAVTRSMDERFGLKHEGMKVLEVTKMKSTSYLISFEQNGRSYIVDSDPSGNLSIVRKTRV